MIEPPQPITDNPNASNDVRNYNGDYLFSLEFNPANNSVSLASYISVFLSLLGFVFLVLFIKAFCADLLSKKGKNYSTIVFLTLIVVLRYCSIKFAFPESFYSFDLFSPTIFANANSIWLTSLGDLLLNVILLFYLTYVFFNDCEFDAIVNRLQKINKLILSFLFFLAFLFFPYH